MTPRDFQQAAMTEVGKRFREGKRAVLVVSPTGSGKTCMGAMMVAAFVRAGKKVAWGAHRQELVEQAADTLRSFGLEVGVNGETAHAAVQLGTFQQWTARQSCPEADVFVPDEAHHMGDKVGWQLIPNTYKKQGARLIGLTATPARADGRPLPDFDCIVVAAQIHELQQNGLLVPMKWRGPDVETVHALRDRRAIAKHPAEAYVDEAAGRCAVVFASNMTSAEAFTDRFKELGVRAAIVRGDMKDEARRIALDQHRNGQVDVLVNVQVLTEGWDNPRCDCVIVARGCESEALWIQMVGRGLRPFPGKSDCLLLDLRGLAHTLGRPDAPATYSLEGCGITITEKGPAGVRLCKVCRCVLDDLLVCPECGHDHTPKVTKIVDVCLNDWDEAWVAVRNQQSPNKLVLALAGILHRSDLAAREGRPWKRGAAEQRFRVIFKRMPYANELARARTMVDSTERAARERARSRQSEEASA